MSRWRKTLVAPTDSVRDVIAAIDASAMQIAIVVDADMRLQGTVTDGDVRRAILRGVGLEEPIRQVMNPLPTVARDTDTKDHILSLMELKRLHQIPVVDDEHRVVRVQTMGDLLRVVPQDNWVLLMAGGLGSRLGDLTRKCPKPMLELGGRPILQTIIELLSAQGFRKFYISVNYLAEVVKAHFGDGSSLGVRIEYLDETRRMGTAGALSLLPEIPSQTLIVMNGDLLTKLNMKNMLDFHAANRALATMCVREYSFNLPYGVVNIDRNQLLSIDEKPLQSYFVAGGIYAFEPEVIERVTAGEPVDMPDFFSSLLAQQVKTSVYPIREYWLDIGRVEDFYRAANEFDAIFPSL